MSEIWKDGFGHYGGSPAGTDPWLDPAGLLSRTLMLSGEWAEIAGGGCGVPSWGARTGTYSFEVVDFGGVGARRVLPTAQSTLMCSFGFSVSSLPANNSTRIWSMTDTSNAMFVSLNLRTDGFLFLTSYTTDIFSPTTLVTTSSSVVRAQTWHHFELRWTATSFDLYVDSALVMSLAGATFKSNAIDNPSITTTTQIVIGAAGPNSDAQTWFADLIVRNTAGTRNNYFPMGDRRVATLFPAADGQQGWTPRPRKKMGIGVGDFTALNSGLYSLLASTGTDLGAGDFTIETFVRFADMPPAKGKAVIMQKWNEGANKRSYQLYKGGDSLEGGNLVFRTSTDGSARTISESISFPWSPALNHWYHLALVRSAGELLLFIDGVQQGLPVADSSTYYAGSARLAVGCEFGSVGVVNSFTGYLDETRLTVGYARYSTNFAVPTSAFPRGSVGDSHWAQVLLLLGYDATIADESSFARDMTNQNVVVNTPQDGTYGYQCVRKAVPADDTFIEAPYLPASAIFTLTAQPANNDTITVGTYSVSNTTAVYKWKTALTGAAFEVLIGATMQATLANMIAAINKAAGEGTLYGTGTVVNNDVSASALLTQQMVVTANLPGTAGNALAVSESCANGSWDHVTLYGGTDIPGPSDFYFDRPPNQTTVIDSMTIVHREYKTDSGDCTTRAAFVGPQGTVANGTTNVLTVNPTYYEDILETDPDTAAGLTPTTIIGGQVRMTRLT